MIYFVMVGRVSAGNFYVLKHCCLPKFYNLHQHYLKACDDLHLVDNVSK